MAMFLKNTRFNLSIPTKIWNNCRKSASMRHKTTRYWNFLSQLFFEVGENPLTGGEKTCMIALVTDL